MVLQMTTAPRAPKETKKEGSIPAVYYGTKTPSTPIFINAIEFKKVLASAGESSSIVLVTEKGNENAMIKDVQLDPVKSNPIHADFYVIEKGQKVSVKTPIVFTGESQAVKDGGVLVKVLHELHVEGEPHLLPHEFTVDISALVTKDDVIHVSAITLPAGVTLDGIGENDTVASITEVVEETETVPVAADLSTIEVEEKGKKDEATEGEVETVEPAKE
jgi:large subunit ribosomal protein L25